MKEPVELRTYPWPYKAALSFSNDCDFLTLDAMLNLHRLFAGAQTEGGFGLELSDSFFFFQNRSLYPHYSYFDNVSATPTRAAPVIREMLRTGHLDTTHALGDFEAGGFRRQLTQQAFEVCQAQGLSIPVWSNHGGYSNWQNIGRKEFVTYHSGDDFLSPYYHVDLLEAMGVRYFWTDVSKSKTISLQPSGPVVTERDRHAPVWRWVWPFQKAQQDYRLDWDYERRTVFESFETRSARRLQGFVRYDGFFPDGDADHAPESLLTPAGVRAGPNLGRIALSLTEKLLDKLVASAGCCFLYQHFSTLAHVPRRTHITAALEFHPDNILALRRLKRYERNGDIWVAAQAILLDYIYMLNTVEVRPRKLEASKLSYRLKVKKGFQYRGCSGLTFAIGADVGSTDGQPPVVRLEVPDGQTLDCELEGPDDAGRLWAAVPIRRLAPLDWRAVAREANVEMSDEIRIRRLSGECPVDLRLPAQENDEH